MSLFQEVAIILALSALRHAGAASVLQPYNDAAESAARRLLAEIDTP
jgi:hypothetical protein